LSLQGLPLCFVGLTKELSAWANIFCSDVLPVGQTRWHTYGQMVYGYLSGPPDEWPAPLARRLEDRMARCQKVAFFCHTTAHWTLAVADPGSRLVRVFDSYPGRSAGQEVGLALASFFSEHLPTPLSPRSRNGGSGGTRLWSASCSQTILTVAHIPSSTFSGLSPFTATGDGTLALGSPPSEGG
jgi:hypothetical protein